jgi:hypothetical protein
MLESKMGGPDTAGAAAATGEAGACTDSARRRQVDPLRATSSIGTSTARWRECSTGPASRRPEAVAFVSPSPPVLDHLRAAAGKGGQVRRPRSASSPGCGRDGFPPETGWCSSIRGGIRRSWPSGATMIEGHLKPLAQTRPERILHRKYGS